MAKQKSTTAFLSKGKEKIKLYYPELRKAVLILRSVNHQLRQSTVDILTEHDSLTVTDIYIKLRVEQSVASQHLAILRRAGIVESERKGKFIYYSLNHERLVQVAGLIDDLSY